MNTQPSADVSTAPSVPVSASSTLQPRPVISTTSQDSIASISSAVLGVLRSSTCVATSVSCLSALPCQLTSSVYRTQTPPGPGYCPGWDRAAQPDRPAITAP